MQKILAIAYDGIFITKTNQFCVILTLNSVNQKVPCDENFRGCHANVIYEY